MTNINDQGFTRLFQFIDDGNIKSELLKETIGKKEVSHEAGFLVRDTSKMHPAQTCFAKLFGANVVKWNGKTYLVGKRSLEAFVRRNPQLFNDVYDTSKKLDIQKALNQVISQAEAKLKADHQERIKSQRSKESDSLLKTFSSAVDSVSISRVELEGVFNVLGIDSKKRESITAKLPTGEGGVFTLSKKGFVEVLKQHEHDVKVPNNLPDELKQLGDAVVKFLKTNSLDNIQAVADGLIVPPKESETSDKGILARLQNPKRPDSPGLLKAKRAAKAVVVGGADTKSAKDTPKKIETHAPKALEDVPMAHRPDKVKEIAEEVAAKAREKASEPHADLLKKQLPAEEKVPGDEISSIGLASGKATYAQKAKALDEATERFQAVVKELGLLKKQFEGVAEPISIDEAKAALKTAERQMKELTDRYNAEGKEYVRLKKSKEGVVEANKSFDELRTAYNQLNVKLEKFVAVKESEVLAKGKSTYAQAATAQKPGVESAREAFLKFADKLEGRIGSFKQLTKVLPSSGKEAQASLNMISRGIDKLRDDFEAAKASYAKMATRPEDKRIFEEDVQAMERQIRSFLKDAKKIRVNLVEQGKVADAKAAEVDSGETAEDVAKVVKPATKPVVTVTKETYAEEISTYIPVEQLSQELRQQVDLVKGQMKMFLEDFKSGEGYKQLGSSIPFRKGTDQNILDLMLDKLANGKDLWVPELVDMLKGSPLSGDKRKEDGLRFLINKALDRLDDSDDSNSLKEAIKTRLDEIRDMVGVMITKHANVKRAQKAAKKLKNI